MDIILKREVGNANPQRFIVAFLDRDARDLVKPEFVSVASARGGAMLKELKEDVRRNVEPQLIRTMEDGK